MTIDFHTHIFPRHMLNHREEYMKRDSCFAELNSSPKAKIICAEELIESMDKESIQTSVILNIGWCSHELCVETNDYIMESAARYSGRLYPFCTIQPTSAHALSELERCIRNGIYGIGEMRPDIQGYDLCDKQLMSDIVALCIKNNLCFLTHSSEPVGHQYSGKGNISTAMLFQFASNFPQLKFICSHWGGGLPFYALMPEVAEILKNTYFDTAASPFLYRPQIYEHMVNIISSKKILFGSDYPLMPQSRVISQIQQAHITKKAKQDILADNARSILNINCS